MSERVTVQIVLDQTYETKVLGILIYGAVGVDLGPIGRRHDPAFGRATVVGWQITYGDIRLWDP